MLPAFFIYALTDPRDGLRRYIGQSGRGMKRPEEHAKPFFMKRDARYYSTRWIKTLLDADLAYGIEILEVTSETQEALDLAENKWIAFGREQAWRLTNHTDGGLGVRGYKHTFEQKAAQSVRLKGRRHSPEHCAKISAALVGRKRSAESRAKQTGRKHSAERRAANSASHAGKPLTLEHRAAISAGNLGKKRSAATRAKISAALKNRSAETYAKIRATLTGVKHSPERRAKQSDAQKARQVREKAAGLQKQKEAVFPFTT